MFEVDKKDEQLKSDIRDYFKTGFDTDLTDKELLECQESLVSLGKAIAEWKKLTCN